jgi:hypothetical protein
MSRIYQSASDGNPALHLGEFWEVLPGELCRPTDGLDLRRSFRFGTKTEEGLYQGDTDLVPIEVAPEVEVIWAFNPDIDPPAGKTRLERLKPGQLFYFEDDALNFQHDWRLQEAVEQGALHTAHRDWMAPRFDQAPVTPSPFDSIVVIVPQIVPPDEAGVCDGCANTGWYYDNWSGVAERMREGAPAITYCSVCHIVESATAAARIARGLGLGATSPEVEPFRQRRRVHYSYTAKISFKSDNPLGIPAVAVEQAIWDLLSEKYPEDIQVCVRADQPTTPLPPPTERSRVISLD